jgi:hypothetical protein
VKVPAWPWTYSAYVFVNDGSSDEETIPFVVVDVVRSFGIDFDGAPADGNGTEAAISCP